MKMPKIENAEDLDVLQKKNLGHTQMKTGGHTFVKIDCRSLSRGISVYPAALFLIGIN